jgi:hypothetical protein
MELPASNTLNNRKVLGQNDANLLARLGQIDEVGKQFPFGNPTFQYDQDLTGSSDLS